MWVDLKDPEGFTNSTRHIKGLGFQGKMCIYPDQVPIVNEILSPSAAYVEWSRKVVQAFDGTTAWVINPMMGSDAQQVVPGGAADLMKNAADFDGALINYKSKMGVPLQATRSWPASWTMRTCVPR